MTTETVLICDACGKKVEEASAMDWRRVECVGIDVATMSDAPLPADLCSGRCIVSYLDLRRVVLLVGED